MTFSITMFERYVGWWCSIDQQFWRVLKETDSEYIFFWMVLFLARVVVRKQWVEDCISENLPD